MIINVIDSLNEVTLNIQNDGDTRTILVRYYAVHSEHDYLWFES